MSIFDIVFWLLIILIAILAFSIESGLSQRHRALVLSSIMSATLAVVYMMFIVEDNSEFAGPGRRAPPPEQEKIVGKADSGRGGGGVPDTEVIEGGGTGEDGDLEDDKASVVKAPPSKDSELLKRPDGFRDCPQCPLMIRVPAGRVIIGSPEGEPGRRSNEGPQKPVRFYRSFTVSRYEIQYGEFAAFVRATGYKAGASCIVDGKVANQSWQNPMPGVKLTPDHPVVCLTYKNVQAYIKWLSDLAARKYRLLAEAEWEYVARAGTSKRFWTGLDITASQANFGGTNNGTVPGSKYDDNAFRLYNTAGNVWEMVEDCWSNDLSNVPGSGVSELSIGDCSLAPVKGGAWNSPKTELRTAFRRPISRDQAFNNVGFRLAREIK